MHQPVSLVEVAEGSGLAETGGEHAHARVPLYMGRATNEPGDRPDRPSHKPAVNRRCFARAGVRKGSSIGTLGRA